MWQKAPRAVSAETAKLIVEAARANHAEAVGVFVDEDADEIASRCSLAGLKFAQLHGDGARDGINHLPEDLGIIYVLQVTPEGEVVTKLPPSEGSEEGGGRRPDWIVVDGLQGGSGVALDWTKLHKEKLDKLAVQGWLLAGGLHPGNVAEAIAVANPTGVDVSSGVCGSDKLLKDEEKVLGFIQGARGAFEALEAKAKASSSFPGTVIDAHGTIFYSEKDLQ